MEIRNEARRGEMWYDIQTKFNRQAKNSIAESM